MARTLNEHLLNDSHNFISLSGVEFAIQRHLQLIFQELSKLPLFHFASAHDTANFQNHETMKFSRVLIEIIIIFFFQDFDQVSLQFDVYRGIYHQIDRELYIVFICFEENLFFYCLIIFAK